jgi:hypothetical protein
LTPVPEAAVEEVVDSAEVEDLGVEVVELEVELPPEYHLDHHLDQA